MVPEQLSVVVGGVIEAEHCATKLVIVGFTGGTLSTTVTVTVTGVPLQPFATGVIVNVVVFGFLESVLVSVPIMVVPDPVAGIVPVITEVLSRVQVKVVPGMLFGFVITMFVIAAPGQMVCVKGVAETVGN